MSIEDRLRTGLEANTQHLRPNLDHELAVVLRRAHSRRKVRIVAVAAVAATVAGILWLAGGPSLSDLGIDRSEPVKQPDKTSEATPMAGINGGLEPGTYLMPVLGPGGNRVPSPTLQVPDGWGTPGGYVLDAGADGDPAESSALIFTTVRKVPANACHPAQPTDPGPTTDDLAGALADMRGPRATRPKPVTVNGNHGQYVKLTVPPHADVYACEDGWLTFWRPNTNALDTGIPGAVFRLWILDVHGSRIVIEAAHTPQDSQQSIDDLTQIVESTTFTDPPTPDP